MPGIAIVPLILVPLLAGLGFLRLARRRSRRRAFAKATYPDFSPASERSPRRKP